MYVCVREEVGAIALSFPTVCSSPRCPRLFSGSCLLWPWCRGWVGAEGSVCARGKGCSLTDLLQLLLHDAQLKSLPCYLLILMPRWHQ